MTKKQNSFTQKSSSTFWSSSWTPLPWTASEPPIPFLFSPSSTFAPSDASCSVAPLLFPTHRQASSQTLPYSSNTCNRYQISTCIRILPHTLFLCSNIRDCNVTRSLCSGPELIKLSYLPCALLCWTFHTNLVDHCLCDHVFADLISIDNCSAHAASHCHFKLPGWLQFILKTTVTQCVAKFNQFLPTVKPLRIFVNIWTPETHQLFETHLAVLLVKLFQPAFSWKFWTHWPKDFF